MKKRIMIVDDDKDCLFSVKQILEGTNDSYTVICISNAMDCFNELKNGNIPDLILLDIMMPEIDGWTVFKKIKAHSVWKKIPLIFLSALPDERDEKIGGHSEITYIKKPFEIDELIKNINNILKK
jgi:putative two-component system response regulator